MRKTVAVAACGLLALTAGCGGSVAAAEAPGVAASPSVETTPSETASAAPTAPEVIGVPEGTPVGEGLISAGLVTTSTGSFTQVTAALDNPCLRLDQSTVEQNALDEFLASDISQALKTVGTFVLSEGINSSLQSDHSPESAAAWVETHKDQFHPDLYASLGADVAAENAKGIVNAYAPDERPYPLVTDGSPRVVAADCVVRNIEAVPDARGLFIYLDVNVQSRGVVDTGPGVERVFGDLAFGVRPDGDRWVISGWNNRWRGITAADGSLDRSGDPSAFEFDDE